MEDIEMRNREAHTEIIEEDVVADEHEINYRGAKALPFIIGNEAFEKLGVLGSVTNLTFYLSLVFHVKTTNAIIMMNLFNGATSFGTLIGAFLSDTYFGRYKTLGFGSVVSFLGLFVIALTAIVKKLHPPHCGSQESSICTGPTVGQFAFLFSGFALMVIGAGCVRPCNFAFGSDQFNSNTESGKKAISTFSNWYYLTLTLAELISSLVIAYIQVKLSWALGLTIPAILMLVSCAIFFMGKNLYVKVKPEGSPLKSMVQVIVVAIKKRGLNLPEQPQVSLYNFIPPESINSKLDYTYQFRFLDKAAVATQDDQINLDGSTANPWGLCSMQQVEEIKCVLRIFPICAAFTIFHVGAIQLQSYILWQATQSNRHVLKYEIPANFYHVVSQVSFTLWLLIYTLILVPYLLKGGGMNILRRMGVGMALSVVALFLSGFVEMWRRNVALTKPTMGFVRGKGEISSLSASWLIPQLILSGLAEAFTTVSQVDFYYNQYPENMRSFAQSSFYCAMGLSNYLHSILVSMVRGNINGSPSGSWLQEDLNKGRLDYYYYVGAAIGVLNLAYFLVCAHWYRFKGSGQANTTATT